MLRKSTTLPWTSLDVWYCYEQSRRPPSSISEEQLKAFLEKVKGDTTLQEKLKAAADSDAVALIANEAGFSISADDLKNAQSDLSELSEKELEGVSGSYGLAKSTNPIETTYCCLQNCADSYNPT